MRTISREIGDFFYLLAISLALVAYVAYASNYVEIPGLEAKVSAQSVMMERVVNLPGGEKFVAFGPKLGDIQTYITEKRPEGDKPRKLTIHRPGGTPLSWDAYLYIQEH